ncbi:MAG: hypothetical protein QNJ05_00745 [Woeseiaceae bacterium]|nr:hypothetical protein [Woeseiaceae bacterium]
MIFNFRKWFSSKAAADGEQQLPDAIHIKIVDGVVIATYLEPASAEETRQVIRYLASTGNYRRRVWDLSQIDFPFTMDELRELAYYGREVMGEASRIAFVVKDTVGYGSLRAFSTYREGGNNAKTSVFRSLDEAMQWVQESD